MRRKEMKTSRAKDITGQTFGELTVLKRKGSSRHGATWACLCSCGKRCVKLGYKIVSGHTKTCGHSTTKTPEEMRKYKLDWYHSNKEPLSGEHKNQNTDKTHCIRGHEFTEENTRLFGEDKEHRKCLICHREDSKQRAREAYKDYCVARKSDPERYEKLRRRKRSAQLKQIGWTMELFEEAWEKQNGKCAICKRGLNQDLKHNENKAHADHEHIEPPKPREILCGNCNLGIGLLMENLEIMQAAVAYVKKWKEDIGT
jgi:hypothetical protein